MLAQVSRTFALTASTLAILAAGTFAGPARAADADTAKTVVRYSDLDLTTAGGEAALKLRIARAARNVCGPAEGRSLADRARGDACVKTAIAGASPQLNDVIASVRSGRRYATNGDAIAMLGH